MIAFDLCLEERGIHYLLKTGFDPEYARFAPGLILRHKMIERAFELGLSRYEFLGDSEPWKLAWTQAARERVRVEAFARSPRGLVEWSANAHGRPLARRVLRRLRR
jgi:CelD/BcsL family acetyltransferase involved in cellulose biosynthesis